MLRLRRFGRVDRRFAFGLMRRANVLALMLTFAVPTLTGGMPYVWCTRMQEAHLHSCCGSHHRSTSQVGHAEGSSGHATIEATCCVGQRLASPPPANANVPALHAIAPASVVAFLTLAELLPVERDVPRILPRRDHREARAGPAPPVYALDCVYLI